jgi:hypothetical protein
VRPDSWALASETAIVTPSPDPRATALSRFLRDRASAFSLSADVNGSQRIADAGMALLDAAILAEHLGPDDPRLVAMSQAGLFESMPHDQARVLETPEVRRALQRPISGSARDGDHILRAIISAIEEP